MLRQYLKRKLLAYFYGKRDCWTVFCAKVYWFWRYGELRNDNNKRT